MHRIVAMARYGIANEDDVRQSVASQSPAVARSPARAQGSHTQLTGVTVRWQVSHTPQRASETESPTSVTRTS
eukprot:2252606-Prymnesium_polylepis.1